MLSKIIDIIIGLGIFSQIIFIIANINSGIEVPLSYWMMLLALSTHFSEKLFDKKGKK